MLGSIYPLRYRANFTTLSVIVMSWILKGLIYMTTHPLLDLEPVWHSSQQLPEFFFFLLNTHFQNSFVDEAIFLLLSQRYELRWSWKK
jgi:hypothetical protein